MFTLFDTGTDTDTETNKLRQYSNGIVVSVQCKHLHTILYNPFLSVCVSVSVSGSVNTPFRDRCFTRIVVCIRHTVEREPKRIMFSCRTGQYSSVVLTQMKTVKRTVRSSGTPTACGCKVKLQPGQPTSLTQVHTTKSQNIMFICA